MSRIVIRDVQLDGKLKVTVLIDVSDTGGPVRQVPVVMSTLGDLALAEAVDRLWEAAEKSALTGLAAVNAELKGYLLRQHGVSV